MVQNGGFYVKYFRFMYVEYCFWHLLKKNSHLN